MELEKVGFIGCGSMGGALLRAVADNGVRSAGSLYVSDLRKESLEKLDYPGLHRVENISLAEECDIIIISVKPQNVMDVIEEIKSCLSPDKVLISIAAGISTSQIESFCEGQPVPVIRVMPNLNITVNAGILPYCLGEYAGRFKGVVEELFSFSGFVFPLEEKKFDAITAISGSGPGFMFFIGEVMSSICRSKGFTPEEADLITAYLIYGSGKNLVETRTAPDILRKMVSSPGGTTLAGLQVFYDKGLQKIFEEAIEKAEKRSRELSSGI